MRRVAIAEWILSCAMPRERASAAAGDMEEFPGDLSFWLSVGRLGVSASFSSLAKTPVGLLWMALLQWFAYLLGWVFYAWGTWLVWAIVYFSLELFGEPLGYHLRLTPPAGLNYIVGFGLLPAWAAWKMGCDLSRKAPGRELASWYAMAVMWTGLGLWAKLPLFTIAVPLLCLLAGMLRTRWVELRQPA